MRLSNKTIEEVKNRIDIVDVIGDFVQLKKAGRNFRALSPFTNEKTPSFFVVPHKEIYKDFSSGKAGDAIHFVMEYDGLSYPDAIVYLAKKYGIEVEQEEQTDEQMEAQNERESLFIISNFAKDHFVHNLWETEEGRSIGLSYFHERGFKDDTIKKFELGYSLDEWHNLEETAGKKGYNTGLLEKTGLVVVKDDKHYDRFRGRVMFPIHNATGKAIAFGARILTKDKKQPKYLNSPETDIYHKSDVLYGLFQAKRAIRQEDNCYLVEGYTDVISMHQAGIENVVSSSGTALTENQIRLIRRHTENITVLFDGDEAGIRASMRGIDMILKEGMKVRCVVFPEGEDPDSYARKLGAMNYRAYLEEERQDFITFKARLLLKGTQNDPIKKADTIVSIVQSISIVPDPVARSVYLKETSNILDIEESVLIAELNKILIQKRHEDRRDAQHKEKQAPDTGELVEQVKESVREQKVDPVFVQEQECIRLLVNYGFNEVEEEYKLYDHYLEELEGIEFQTPVVQEILELFRQKIESGNIPDPDDFFKDSPEHIKKTLIHLVSEQHEVSENWQRYHIYIPKEEELITNAVYANLLRLKFRKIRTLLEKNRDSIKEAQEEEKLTELMRINMELKKAEMEYAKPLGIVISS
jgi:DNA primase